MRAIACATLAALAMSAVAPATAAEAFPSRPMRFVVGFLPGGPSDTLARVVGQKHSEALGQPVVIDNRPGAGGNVGLEVVARSTPDGYTLLYSSGGPIIIGPHLYKLGVDVTRDLVPVAPVTSVALLLVVRPGLPVRTLPELITYARANPGKLSYGTSGGIRLWVSINANSRR